MNEEPRHFGEELAALKDRLLLMGQLAEERLRTVLGALVARDHDLLAEVVSGDGRMNDLQIEIDRRCFTLIALNQPVAVDLRTIVSALNINTDLERIGDLAVNIGEAAQRYLVHPPVKPLVDVPRMGDLALKMLRGALDAFVTRELKLAHTVLGQDEWLEALKNQILRELLTYMLAGQQMIEPSIDLILVSHHLKRIGDHATNIAEDVIFIVEGRDIRQRPTRPVPNERRKPINAALI